jgi:malonate transporter and related proteins
MAMVETVLTALAPVVVTLLLGFVAAWHQDFGAKDAAVLNRMVLLYAVPVALFVGTVGTPRGELVQDVAFAVAMFVAIVGDVRTSVRMPQFWVAHCWLGRIQGR